MQSKARARLLQKPEQSPAAFVGAKPDANPNTFADPLAGGILRMQRTIGNRAVSRMVDSGQTAILSRQVIQRDPQPNIPFPPPSWKNPFPSPKDPFGTPAHDPNELAPSDMVEMNWTPMVAPSKGPDQPNMISIEFGEPPKAPGANPQLYQGGACKSMNCHQPVGGGPHYDFPQKPKTWDDGSSRAWAIYQERRDDWARLKTDSAKMVGSFNRTVPLIRKYYDVSQDPELAKLYGVPTKGGGDLGSKVEGQVVGGAQVPKGVTVGGLFGTGTSVDTKDIDKNIDKAAKGDVNSGLVTALAALKAADHDFEADSAAVASANKAAKAAAEEAEAAHFLVEEQKAAEEKEKAEKELAEVKEKAEKVKKYIGWAIKGVTFVAGLVLAPEVTIPAAVAGGTQLDLFPNDKPKEAAKPESGEKKGGLPEGIGEKATWVAEKAVDFWYASDMAKASANITKAAADMRAAHKGYLNANELAKADALAAALDNVTKAIEKLKARIVKRRNAFREVARQAAAAAGGSPKQQQKLQGMIMAIPACEGVVASTSNILDSIEDVPYSRESGVAFGMAMNGGTDKAGAALSFTDSLGYLNGYKADFVVTKKLWSDRLANAKQILVRLGIDTA